MKKRILGFVLLLTMMLSSVSVPVIAANDIIVTLDGETLSFDTPPQIINGRTMVPLRAIFEALGASVEWNDNTKTITSSKDGYIVEITVGGNTMKVNGISTTIDTPACIVDGRVLVPIRAISEAYNAIVTWDVNTKTVTISNNSGDISNSAYSLSAFDKLKNGIIENGTYNEEKNEYSIYSDYDGEELYDFSYDPENEIIGLKYVLESDEYSICVCLVIKQNDNPAVGFMVTKKSNGAKYLNGGYFLNSQFICTVVSDSRITDITDVIETIKASAGIMEIELNFIGIDVTMADLGIPTK